MTLDPYSPCPGGMGKKIKFCCSDLLHELESLGRLINADQRIAALELATKLDDKHPGRACLLAARAMLESMLDKRDAARATAERFIENHPENPLAISNAAQLAVAKDPTEAIELLLKALRLGHDDLPEQVYDAIGGVALGLAARGYLVTARMLLQMQVELSQWKDDAAVKRWLALEGDPGLSLLFKDNARLVDAPAGAAWKYEFDRALEPANMQDWPGAAEKFKALIPLAGASPALWRNLATLRGWLADYAGMAEAWRKLAALDAPLDDRVEAEAKAMLLDIALAGISEKEPPPGLGDLLLVHFPVRNLADLGERLNADRQTERVEHGPEAWRQDVTGGKPDEPLPREVFLLLDRAPPAESAVAAELSPEQIPCIVASLAVFGRQTDRPERIELMVARGELSAAAERLERIAGDALGPRESERIVESASYFDNGLQWQWRFPVGTPLAQRETLLRDERRRRLLEVWPDAPDSLLDGQTPRQLAADAKNRVRVLARILIIEATDPTSPDAAAFNELRRRLGLPAAEAIDPATVDLDNLPPVRVHRLQVEKLADDALIGQYRQATVLRMRRTLAKLTAELVRRPQLNDRVDMAEAHGSLAMVAEDTATMLAEIERARAAAVRLKKSAAKWDVMEFELRIRRGEPDEAYRVLDRLQRHHFQEPGVSEAVLQILYSAGLIDEQGRSRLPPQEERSSLVLPGAEPGKLVVPGGETAAAGAGQGAANPVIWTPGMD